MSGDAERPGFLWEGLPDSRLLGDRRARTEVILNGRRYERCFCVNCGRPWGLVTAEWAAHVLALCDDCCEAHGKLPLPEIPEDLARGR